MSVRRTKCHRALAGVDIGAIFVSTRVRASETAVPLARDRRLEKIGLPDIHKIEAGEFEGSTDRETAQR